MPAPDPKVLTYDRGSQAFIITGATTNVAQVGSAKPVAATAYGIVGALSRTLQPPNLGLQIDVGGTGALTSGTVNVLGSLDGVNFDVIGTVVIAAGKLAAGSTQIQAFAGNAQFRYICASISNVVVSSGAPTISVSFDM